MLQDIDHKVEGMRKKDGLGGIEGLERGGMAHKLCTMYMCSKVINFTNMVILKF